MRVQRPGAVLLAPPWPAVRRCRRPARRRLRARGRTSRPRALGSAVGVNRAPQRRRGGRGGAVTQRSASTGSTDPAPAPRSETDLVIVTGVSGGGRSTVARALENVGYYVVDNLPQALMLDMAELAYAAGGTARHTAMVLDVRSRAFSTDLTGAVKALRDRGFTPRVLFVDADDEVLIRRFEKVRPPHPLQGARPPVHRVAPQPGPPPGPP